MRVFLAFCALSAAIAAELSPAEIVRRATERESDNAQLRRQYTYRESMWQRIAKKDGEVGNDGAAERFLPRGRPGGLGEEDREHRLVRSPWSVVRSS